MPVTQPVSEMITTARLLINQVSVHEAAKLQRLEATILIDLRDVRELQKMGVVPQAFHAQRGMLEFWAEPDSPYHKPVFRTGKKLVLFCASGLRSALATRTLQEYGHGQRPRNGGRLHLMEDAGPASGLPDLAVRSAPPRKQPKPPRTRQRSSDPSSPASGYSPRRGTASRSPPQGREPLQAG